MKTVDELKENEQSLLLDGVEKMQMRGFVMLNIDDDMWATVYTLVAFSNARTRVIIASSPFAKLCFDMQNFRNVCANVGSK